VHSSNSKAWKHFNSVHTHFSVESMYAHLGLCTDGFNPFGSFAASYSWWPIILSVYNLPPGMCMRPEFMFLSTVIPGPSSPGRNIDVILRPNFGSGLTISILYPLSIEYGNYLTNTHTFRSGRICIHLV